jgi:hypothetical protein
MNRRGILALGLVVVSTAFVGCTSNQIIAALTGVVSAVEVVFPVIASEAGLPADVTNRVSVYLAAVSDASGKASDILASTDSPTAKALEITALFAGVTAPDLPPGTPQNIARAVVAVTQAVAAFLKNFANSQGARVLSAAPPVQVKASDKKQLAKIKERAAVAATKAKALRK